MKVNTRRVDGVTILDLSGRITLGEGSVQLRDVAEIDLLSKGNKQFLVNLDDLNYIDSSSIDKLVSAYSSVRNQGGEVKLLHLIKKVHDLLQITKLYAVPRLEIMKHTPLLRLQSPSIADAPGALRQRAAIFPPWPA